MINTLLHNQLIDQESQKRVLENQRQIQIVKKAVIKERLKSYLLISLFLFLMIFILLLLYKFYLSNFSNDVASKHNKEQLVKEANNPTKKSDNKVYEKQSEQKGIPKDGIDYVKQNNYVYKRVWKDGILESQTKLEETIDDSRKKLKEKIPQMSVPKKQKTMI